MAELKKENKTINVYFHQMKALSDSLTIIGMPLRDEEFTSYILGGLDNDYDALFEVVTARQTPMSIRDLFSQLQSTEQRKLAQRRTQGASHYPAAHMAAHVGPSVAAFGATRGQPAPSFSSPPAKTGAPSNTPKPNNGRGTVVCQLCGVHRHVALKCYKRFNRDFLGIGNDGKNTEKQLAMAMTASQGSQGASQRVDWRGTLTLALCITSPTTSISSLHVSPTMAPTRFIRRMEKVCVFIILVMHYFLLHRLNHSI